MVAAAEVNSGDVVVSSGERARVIFASTLGTVFEWYDFYLYAVLAPFFAALFFPPGNQTAALLSAFADDSQEGHRPRLALGEGLIGQCAVEKRRMLITDLPEEKSAAAPPMPQGDY